ncbi:mitochondrial carrier [Clavulina sp. PMI_390]|nr:mitochondrial carrier [Clavulina sp. PMI_390]
MSSTDSGSPNDSQKGGTNVKLVGAIAGVGSGLTKVALGHGFDTIKTRMQCVPPGTYKGVMDCFLQTVRNESVFALYKGATPPAIGWAAIDSVLLGSLHNYRLTLLRHGMGETSPSDPSKMRLSLLGHGIAGLMAGPTSALIATPIEGLKAKLQLQTQRNVADRQFKGPIDAIRQIVRAQGVPGLWSGLPASMLFRANFFWMFGGIEVLMRSFSKLDGTPNQLSTGTKTFFAGGLASFVFWVFAMPFDSIKNQIMVQPLDKSRAQRLSIPHVARRVYNSYGLRGFYRGFTPCIIRAFPVNSSAYFVYEALLRAMNAESVSSLQ